MVERAAFYEEKLTRTGVYTDYESAVPIERLSKEYQALRIALVSFKLPDVLSAIATVD